MGVVTLRSLSSVTHALTSEEGRLPFTDTQSLGTHVDVGPPSPSFPISALLHQLPPSPPGDPEIKCSPFHQLKPWGTCNVIVTLNGPFVGSQLPCARTLQREREPTARRVPLILKSAF